MERPDAAAIPLSTSDAVADLSAGAAAAGRRIAALLQRIDGARTERRAPLGRSFSQRYGAPAAGPAPLAPPAPKPEEADKAAAATAAEERVAAPLTKATEPAGAEPEVEGESAAFEIEIPEPLFEESEAETAARRRRLSVPTATATVAAAALLASAGVVAQGEFAALESAERAESGAAVAGSAAHIEKGASWRASAAGRDAAHQRPALAEPVIAADPIALGEISTATIAPAPDAGIEDDALEPGTVRRLLAEKPVRCVIDGPAMVEGEDKEALRAVSRAEECVEITEYDPGEAMLRRVASAPDGGQIEINAAYSVSRAGLCHHTAGLSALVVGADSRSERARSLEALLAASYAALNGAPICHRWIPLGPTRRGVVYRSEAYVNGVFSEERTDPRPFVLKKTAPPLAR